MPTTPEELKQKSVDNVTEIEKSLGTLKQSLIDKKINDDDGTCVSLIKEMATNILTFNDSQDPEVKKILSDIEKDNKVDAAVIDKIIKKMADVKLKILGDKSNAYTSETEAKYTQISELISHKDALNSLLQTINTPPAAPTPTTTPTPPAEKESWFKRNRKWLLGIGGA